MTTTDQRAAWAVDMTDGLWKCPNGQYAVQAGYMLAGFGQHRDSDAVARTNYLEAQRLICEAAGQEWTGPGDLECFNVLGDQIYTDPVIYGSWRHWAVGWIEELLVRVDCDAATRTAFELHTYVTEQYPILNDDLWSMIEDEDNHPDADDLCYSDNPDCECGRSRA
jgi:hypothetical protein